MKSALKNSTKNAMLLFCILIGLLVGCQEQEILPVENIDVSEGLHKGEPTKLGKQLENPYSVENMKKALESLSSKSQKGFTESEVEIYTTHLYVRFLPADTLETAILDQDTLLELYDYPLDFEIEEMGQWYHDPTLPESAITWQYTVVPVDYTMPNIQHEVLADLFLPEELIEGSERVSARKLEILRAIEDESLRMTGNWEDAEQGDNDQRTESTWSGRIMVEEHINGTFKSWMPVKELKVRARRWFTTRVDFTDSRGYYSISSFRRPANYSILFTTRYAKISNALALTTTHNGPKIRGGWSLNIAWHSESWVRGTLVNTAVEFKKQCSLTGVHTPFPLNYWAGGNQEAVDKLEMRAVFAPGRSDMMVFTLNRLRIYSKRDSDGRNLETDALYRLSFHELAHQSHYKLNWDRFLITNPIIIESWAEFIHHNFTKAYYPLYVGSAHGQLLDWDNYIWNKSGGESNKSKDKWKYTALFTDIQDSYAQVSNASFYRPNDQVSGYTTQQLQNAIKKSHNLWLLRDYLKNSYHNSTEDKLDLLFDFYIKVEQTRKI